MHEQIKKCAKAIEPVGSRVTCVPAPTDTDQDYLVLANSEHDFYEMAGTLQGYGWEMCGDEEYTIPIEECLPEGYFQSFRKGDINYIITSHKEFFKCFMEATAVAKQHNLLRKQERVALFQWLMYDVFVDGVEDYLNEKWPDECNIPPSVEQMIEAVRSLPDKEKV